jgi:hypothetical protein
MQSIMRRCCPSDVVSRRRMLHCIALHGYCLDDHAPRKRRVRRSSSCASSSGHHAFDSALLFDFRPSCSWVEVLKLPASTSAFHRGRPPHLWPWVIVAVHPKSGAVTGSAHRAPPGPPFAPIRIMPPYGLLIALDHLRKFHCNCGRALAVPHAVDRFAWRIMGSCPLHPRAAHPPGARADDRSLKDRMMRPAPFRPAPPHPPPVPSSPGEPQNIMDLRKYLHVLNKYFCRASSCLATLRCPVMP